MEESNMISKEELQILKRRFVTSLYYLEKEYLQILLLFLLFREYNTAFLFKGGTCLRHAYHYSRLSEDLDFDTTFKPASIKKAINHTLNQFTGIGLAYKFVKEELFRKSYTTKIQIKGPLFTGSEDSVNSLRLDIGMKNKFKGQWVQINQIFSDIPQFFVYCMDESEILAEKVRALIMRGKPRDLFDVWVIKNKLKNINKNLIEKKLNEVGLKYPKSIKFCSEKEFERDLRYLLMSKIDYKQVKKDVEIFLRKL